MNRSTDLTRWLKLPAARSRTPALGKRELAILEVLWQQGALSVQQVHASLQEDISLNTVQSTLERLHRKDLLQRRKESRAFFYSAVLQKQALISNLLHDIAADLSGGDMTPMVSGFIDYLADVAPAMGDRLHQALNDEPDSCGANHDSRSANNDS
jgi:predicted transcriptional regulator